MKAQQNQASRVLTMSANSLWSDIIAMGSVNGFTYNNEPKQGGIGV